MFHDWKRLLDQFPEDQRVFFWREKTESLPSSSLSLALPLVFTKQQQTDQKRVFGFEFMEPAEFHKALRDSTLLSGVKTRFRSKTTLIAHPPADWGGPRLAGLVLFFCFSRTTESSIVGSVLQRTHPCARIVVELFGSRCLTGASVSKKGEAKRTHELACQL